MPVRRTSWWFAAAAPLVAMATASGADTLAGWLGLPETLEAPWAAHAEPAAASTSAVPHPAVARIIVPEGDGATSYGSGTLVDVRDGFGLVITNWHVVRDGTGEVEVEFPDGFRSKARPLKVDSDWDLAALVIWRPPAAPVAIAAVAPQAGDRLTICGYGSGQYRAVTGRCTQYYAPAVDLPQHMVELDVEARQGDSGGPILNDRGELAGVLFGAGQGTTLGSFGGRVGSFLATLAPDIGRPADPSQTPLHEAPQVAAAPEPQRPEPTADASPAPTATLTAAVDRQPPPDSPWQAVPPSAAKAEPPAPASSLALHAKNVLAAVGVLALALQALRAVR